MPQCCGVMFGCETQLCCFVVWSYTVLCPAFQWLLSKHTQEMKALSPRTHCEWSFVLLESSRGSKGRARRLVSLSTVRSNMAWNIKHIKSVNNLTSCRSIVALHWNFLISQWSGMQITGPRIFRRAGVVLLFVYLQVLSHQKRVAIHNR